MYEYEPEYYEECIEGDLSSSDIDDIEESKKQKLEQAKEDEEKFCQHYIDYLRNMEKIKAEEGSHYRLSNSNWGQCHE